MLEKSEKFVVSRRHERYEGLGDKFPVEMRVIGTRQQALRLAVYLSEYYPGCEGLYRVEGVDNEEQVEAAYEFSKHP